MFALISNVLTLLRHAFIPSIQQLEDRCFKLNVYHKRCTTEEVMVMRKLGKHGYVGATGSCPNLTPSKSRWPGWLRTSTNMILRYELHLKTLGYTFFCNSINCSYCNCSFGALWLSGLSGLIHVKTASAGTSSNLSESHVSLLWERILVLQVHHCLTVITFLNIDSAWAFPPTNSLQCPLFSV